MAKLIGITSEKPLPEEPLLIATALDAGIDIIHLRKPKESVRRIDDLLKAIPEKFHGRIVLHDFHQLAHRYAVRGIHLNRRFPAAPEDFQGTTSCSCHTLAEIVARKPLHDYLFLSPVRDSISKQGYHAAFTRTQLENAARDGVVDRKVIALGGISPDNIAEIISIGFGGAAVLGYLWKNPDTEAVKRAVDKLKLNMSGNVAVHYP